MNNDLISREALLAKQYNASNFVNPMLAEMVVDVSDIEDAPAVDAVPVVRCKDCKWRNENDDCTHKWWRDAEGWDKYVEDNDFCSYGERKE